MSASDERLSHQLLTSRPGFGPDDICGHYADAGVALKVCLLKKRAGEEGVPDILIEGEKQDFVFLADLLIAQAGADHCGKGLSPTEPGNRLLILKANSGVTFTFFPATTAPRRASKTKTPEPPR